MFFANVFKIKKVRKPNIKYGDIQIKQNSNKYLGCMLDEIVSGEAMAISIVNKFNKKLKFLYQKYNFSIPTLKPYHYFSSVQRAVLSNINTYSIHGTKLALIIFAFT